MTHRLVSFELNYVSAAIPNLTFMGRLATLLQRTVVNGVSLDLVGPTAWRRDLSAQLPVPNPRFPSTPPQSQIQI